MKKNIKVSLVSLGCPKNLVDSENILGELAAQGFEIVEDNEQAEIIIVNTCAFIQPAQEESIEALLDLAELKETGQARALICVGCLPQRHGEELLSLLPEVDAFLGIGAAPQIATAIRRVLQGERIFMPSDRHYLASAQMPRWRSAPEWLAYLKIADGCNNRCTYCTIPDIRGPYRSRPLADIVAEFQQLVAEGCREICLIAQDTTMYGCDLPGHPELADLLEALGEFSFSGWLRIMYMHPEHISERLLHTMAAVPAVLPYLDIPMQHVSPSVLQRMGRTGSPEKLLALIQQIRAIMPEAAIRTTFMTGFPQETEEDFAVLLHFLEQAQLDRVSAFRYWAEEGTPAAAMPGQLPEEIRDERLAQLLAFQEAISLEINRRFVGRILPILLEKRLAEGLWQGRSYRDAPEIDGEVRVRTNYADKTLQAGEIVNVRITQAEVHDLEGVLV